MLDATAFLMHVQTAPHFYKALVEGPDTGSGPRVLRACFEERVGDALELREEESGSGHSYLKTERAIVTRVVASSLLSVIECWIESNMNRSPREVQAIFKRLVGGGLTALGQADVAHPDKPSNHLQFAR